MKKFITFIILFLGLPIVSFAVNYDIKHFYIDANILENGDMNVQELIVLNGEFNGYERDIIYKNDYVNSNLNASAIENLEVLAKYVDNVSFDTFKEQNFVNFMSVNYANNGESAKYVLSSLNGGIRLRMYYHSSKQTVAFLIKYTLKDVVILHESFGEVYWNFIGDDFEDEINDLKIRVTLPGVDNTDYFRIWAHGELSGEVNFFNQDKFSGLEAAIGVVSKYSPVDIRTTFDSNLLDRNLISKKSNQTLDEIIEGEEVLANEANELRKEIRKKFKVAIGLTTIYYVYTIISFIYVYIKYDKERRPEFNLEYNREFIDDYNVEVVDYLMNNKSITPNALSASIMNLIYKKNIKAEAIPNVKNGYRFTLINEENLSDTEKYLIEFLFERIGKDKTFTTVDLKRYASSTKTCERFSKSYTSWKYQVASDGKRQEFFEKGKKQVLFSVISLIICIFSNMYIMNNQVTEPILIVLSYLSIVLSIGYMFYTLIFTKKTKTGIEHFARWKAFKKFLNDFGNFSIKELPEIILWERYLVYATVFGLADKVEKAMNVKIKEIELGGVNSYTYHDYLFNMHLSNILNSSVNSAIRSNVAAVAQVNSANASSSFSSGSGFGGGFSSGGGSGGGGGGGRGF